MLLIVRTVIQDGFDLPGEQVDVLAGGGAMVVGRGIAEQRTEGAAR